MRLFLTTKQQTAFLWGVSCSWPQRYKPGHQSAYLMIMNQLENKWEIKWGHGLLSACISIQITDCLWSIIKDCVTLWPLRFIEKLIVCVGNRDNNISVNEAFDKLQIKNSYKSSIVQPTWYDTWIYHTAPINGWMTHWGCFVPNTQNIDLCFGRRSIVNLYLSKSTK